MPAQPVTQMIDADTILRVLDRSAGTGTGPVNAADPTYKPRANARRMALLAGTGLIALSIGFTADPRIAAAQNVTGTAGTAGTNGTNPGGVGGDGGDANTKATAAD